MMRRLYILLTISLLILGVSVAAAQTETLTYGAGISGTLTTAPETYAFNGTAGDRITVRVTALAADFVPTIALVNPDGQSVGVSLPDPFTPNSRFAVLSRRLEQSGTFTVTINSASGTGGSFALSLDGQPGSAPLPLTTGTTTQVEFVQNAQPQTFSFTLTPANTTSLLLNADTPDLAFVAIVRDNTGLTVTELNYVVRSARVDFAPAPNTIYELDIIPASPDLAGRVSISVLSTGAAPPLQPTLAPFIPTPTFPVFPTFTPAPTLTPPLTTCTNGAQFVQDITIPDGTVVQAGEPFIKTWRLQNTGTCTWNTDYQFVKVSGDAIIGVPGDAIALPITLPDTLADISMTLQVLPDTEPGSTQRATFRLRDPEGNFFGSQPFVEVVVAE